MFRDNDRENHNLVISHFVLLTEYKQKCNNDVEGGKKKKRPLNVAKTELHK